MRPVTVGVGVASHHVPSDHPDVPHTPKGAPDLVLPRLQVNSFQSGGSGSSALCPQRPCSQTRGLLAGATRSLNCVWAVMWVWDQGPPGLPRPAAAAAVTLVLTCLSVLQALGWFPGQTLWLPSPARPQCPQSVLRPHVKPPPTPALAVAASTRVWTGPHSRLPQA